MMPHHKLLCSLLFALLGALASSAQTQSHICDTGDIQGSGDLTKISAALTNISTALPGVNVGPGPLGQGWQLTSPLNPNDTIQVCFTRAPTTIQHSSAGYYLDSNHIVFSLAWYGRNRLSTTGYAKLRATILHESTHWDHWVNALNDWADSVCMNAEDIDACMECMDEVIACHMADHSCSEAAALQSSLASLCSEDTEGWSPTEVADLQMAITLACTAFNAAGLDCLQLMLDCPNDCGNMAPMPPPPHQPSFPPQCCP